jgi:hypothetical protein
MEDPEKDNGNRRTASTHLDDDSTSSETRDPLELPSLIPPLNAAVEEKRPPEEPPPNGGLNAWLQVLGSFFLFFNSW